MFSLTGKKPELPLKDVESALMLGNAAYRNDDLVYVRMLPMKLFFNYRQTIDSGVIFLDPSDMVETDIPEFTMKRWENLSPHAEYLRYKSNGLIQREQVAFMLSDRYETKTRKIFKDTLTEIVPTKPLVMIDYTPDREKGTARIDALRIKGRKLPLTEANAKKALSLAYYCLQEMTMNDRLAFKQGVALIFGRKRQKQMALAAPCPKKPS